MNRYVLISGAAGGVGRELVRIFLDKGFYVLAGVRSKKRGEELVKYLDSFSSDTQRLELVLFDLSDPVSVSSAVKNLDIPYLDVVIHLAGVFISRRVLTPCGLELQLAVNAATPFYMTHLLLPLLLRSPRSARVVWINSGSHYSGKLHWKNLNLFPYINIVAYAQSKLAQLLIAYELDRRFEDMGLDTVSYAVDPGLVNTDMGFKDSSLLSRLIWAVRKNKGIAPYESAEHIANAVLNIEPQSARRKYWRFSRQEESSVRSHSTEDAEKLWQYFCSLFDISDFFAPKN